MAAENVIPSGTGWGRASKDGQPFSRPSLRSPAPRPLLFVRRRSVLMYAGSLPLLPSLERRSDPSVVDPEVTVIPARDGIGSHSLDLLRDDADINLVAPVVLEAIQANAFGHGADPHDIMLELAVGATAVT